MMNLATTTQRARTLRRLIDAADASSIVGDAVQSQNTSGTALPVRPVDLMRSLNFASEAYDTTIQQPGTEGDWEDTFDSQEVSLVSFGEQIAFNVGGLGMAVHSDAFWAVNVGTTLAATLTIVTEGDELKITGHQVGNAAVIMPHPSGGLRVTTKRLSFANWDEAQIADGTLILLQYVGGVLSFVGGRCAAIAGLTSLPADPASEEEPP